MKNISIFNGDCVDQSKRIPDESVDLGIFDPPFGLGETGFNKHYKRDSSNVISGYKEAPSDYEQWTHLWLSEAKRVLKPNGSMYVFMGHSNLRYLLNAAHNLGFKEINHLIWKYNFGVYTRNKFVTSHYHVLYYKKSKKASPTFNATCRFGSHEKSPKGGSLLYSDMEDVFAINRDYAPKQKKNQNKLPEELIQKIILYSSNEGDTVCDFFMGNFTTAYVSLGLGRRVYGYEMNKKSYEYHMPKIELIEFGEKLNKLKKVEDKTPQNAGKRITDEDLKSVWTDYLKMLKDTMLKKDISVQLQKKYGRGRFAIKNMLDSMPKDFTLDEKQGDNNE